jgi:MFS family permease
VPADDLSADPQPAAPAAPTGVGAVAGLLGLLVALTVIGSSAVAVALPQLSADLDLDTSGAAWILAAFSLAFSISTAAFGRIADLYGLRLPLRIGGLLFGAGSLAAALAPSFAAIVAARLVQGAGAGAVPVLVLGIIAARFPEEVRSRALAGITIVVSLVSGSGPLIGGAITEWLGWRWVLGLPALALLLTEPIARLAPPARRRQGGVDVVGALWVAVSVSGLALLLQSPATGAGGVAAAAFGALLVGGLVLLVRHVRRRPDGFLPRRVVTDAQLMLSAACGLTMLAAYMALLFAVPKMLSSALGWGPLQIGLTMVPAAMVGAVASRVVGVRARPGNQHLIAAGLAAGSAAGLLLGALGGRLPLLPVVGLACAAAGFAAGQVALIDRISATVAPAVRGSALGVFNLVFFIGGTVGAAAAGGLSLLVPLPVALGVLAVLPAVGAGLALAIPRAPRAAAPEG